MKRHEIKQQMYEDLRKTYEKVLRSDGINMDFVPKRTVVNLVLSTPAPRFYLTAKQASAYVLGYYRGDSFVMRHKNLDMIKAMVERYEELRKKHPYMQQSMIWEMLVDSPAPKFYINYNHAFAIIFKHYHYRNHD